MHNMTHCSCRSRKQPDSQWGHGETKNTYIFRGWSKPILTTLVTQQIQMNQPGILLRHCGDYDHCDKLPPRRKTSSLIQFKGQTLLAIQIKHTSLASETSNLTIQYTVSPQSSVQYNLRNPTQQPSRTQHRHRHQKPREEIPPRNTKSFTDSGCITNLAIPPMVETSAANITFAYTKLCREFTWEFCIASVAHLLHYQLKYSRYLYLC